MARITGRDIKRLVSHGFCPCARLALRCSGTRRFVICFGKQRPLEPAAATLLCCSSFIPVSIAAWCLLPVGLHDYASDHFRGRPHRQLVAEPQLSWRGELSLGHHRERQNRLRTSRGAWRALGRAAPRQLCLKEVPIRELMPTSLTAVGPSHRHSSRHGAGKSADIRIERSADVCLCQTAAFSGWTRSPVAEDRNSSFGPGSGCGPGPSAPGPPTPSLSLVGGSSQLPRLATGRAA